MNNMMRNQSIKNLLQKKLTDSLKPVYINVINESYMHNVPKGSETHLKVIVVSDMFIDKSLIERHQMIHNLLQAEWKHNLHALSIIAKTPKQWEGSDKKIVQSPPCQGGFGK